MPENGWRQVRDRALESSGGSVTTIRGPRDFSRRSPRASGVVHDGGVRRFGIAVGIERQRFATEAATKLSAGRRAALALHSGDSNWLDLSSIDGELLSVVLGQEKFSEPIRKGIKAPVDSAVSAGMSAN